MKLIYSKQNSTKQLSDIFGNNLNNYFNGLNGLNYVSVPSFTELFKKIILPKRCPSETNHPEFPESDFWNKVTSKASEHPKVTYWESFDFLGYFEYHHALYNSIRRFNPEETYGVISDSLYSFSKDLVEFLNDVSSGRKVLSDISKEDSPLMFEFCRLFWLNFYSFFHDRELYYTETIENETVKVDLNFNVLSYLLNTQVEFMLGNVVVFPLYEDSYPIPQSLEFKYLSGFGHDTLVLYDTRGYEVFRFLLSN